MLCEDHLAGHGRGVGDEGSAIWTIGVLDRCKLAGTINGKDTKSTLLYARQEVLEEQQPSSSSTIVELATVNSLDPGRDEALHRSRSGPLIQSPVSEPL